MTIGIIVIIMSIISITMIIMITSIELTATKMTWRSRNYHLIKLSITICHLYIPIRIIKVLDHRKSDFSRCTLNETRRR